MIARLILVLGQSNAMAYNTLPNGGSFTPYPGGWTIQPLGAGYADVIWNEIYGWVAYAPGVNSYGYTGGNVPWGPEASIALTKRSCAPQVCTYIFKWAEGGVGLAQNQGQRGAHPAGKSWSPHASGNVFSNFSAALATASAQLVALGITPSVKEVYWIGNESDCFDWASAASLRHDLPAFVAAIRALPYCTEAKFILARTKATLGAVAGPLPYVDIVRYNQEALTWADANCTWIDCDDLASGVLSAGHYEPAGIVTMGQRMAAAA